MNPIIDRRRSARHAATLALAILTLGACGGDESSGRSTASGDAAIPQPSFPAITDSVLARGPGNDWPTTGGDLANHRHSPLDQIDAANVHELVPVWIHSTGIEGAFATTPVVVGNTMYITTAQGRVLALNAATGEEQWSYTPELGPVTLCCGPINRGVSAYADRVYVASLDARLIALQARTGELAWEAELADPARGYSATMAPVAVDGRVYVGVAGERYGVRGFLAAFDGRSGEELWRWHTIPSPEEGGWWGEWQATDPFGAQLGRDLTGERADSAATSGSWGVGGGGIAMTPAYDRESGRLYVNVEGPAPLADGGVRPGDNLYTGSIVALDARTGERVWHTQYLPHDVWGLSGGSPPFLFERGGERYVAFAGRTGWVYVFDADTGDPILRSDNFVPQEAMFRRPASGGGDGAGEGEGPRAVRVAPGANGGNPGTGVAYDPDTGIAFVGGVHQPMVYTNRSERYREGQLWLGGTLRFPPEGEQWGTVSAIDLGDGEIAWQRRTPAPVVSDLLATAGGLLFVGQGNGSFDAFDAATGDLLWSFRTGAGIHGGPVTYRVGDVQYVAVPAGGSYHYDTPTGDDVIAFALASRRPAHPGPRYSPTDYSHGGPARAGEAAVRQRGSQQAAPSTRSTPPDTTAAAAPRDPAADVDSASRPR